MFAKTVRYVAFVLVMVYAVLGAGLVIGFTIADPGGWRAVLLVASWLVPLAALVALALLRPERAATVLTWVTALVAAFVLVYDAVAVRSHNGPVSAVVVFALAVALGFLGLSWATLAGLLMVADGAAPLLGLGIGALVHGQAAGLGGSATAAAVPVLAFGALFLLAGWAEHVRAGRPDTAGHGVGLGSRWSPRS